MTTAEKRLKSNRSSSSLDGCATLGFKLVKFGWIAIGVCQSCQRTNQRLAQLVEFASLKLSENLYSYARRTVQRNFRHIQNWSCLVEISCNHSVDLSEHSFGICNWFLVVMRSKIGPSLRLRLQRREKNNNMDSVEIPPNCVQRWADFLF